MFMGGAWNQQMSNNLGWEKIQQGQMPSTGGAALRSCCATHHVLSFFLSYKRTRKIAIKRI
jgi:hypothetical protein